MSVVVVSILTGCNTTRVTITDSTGRVTKLTNCRFAWSSQEYAWSFNTNGTWTATASASNPDAKTIAAAAGLAQTLLSKAP